MDEVTEEMLLTPRTELARLANLLPSITEERVALRALHNKIDEGKAAPSRGLPKREADLDRAERFAASRPGGCFCLGTGSLYGNICSCPEGVAFQASQDDREKERHARDIRAFVENAGIPPWFADFTLDSYPGSKQALSIVRAHLASDVTYPFFLWGDYGTGKTGLAVGLLKDRVQSFCEGAFFVTVPRLLEMIRSSYNRDDPPHEQALKRARTTALLVLDDLGAERPTDWVQEQLYLVINERHDNKLDTVITSNLTLDQLADRIGERTIWRIAEMCRVVEVKGPNLRDKR